jgi:hypothetical protein
LPILRASLRKANVEINPFSSQDWYDWEGSQSWDNEDPPLLADLGEVDFKATKSGGVSVPAGTYSVGLVADPEGASFLMQNDDDQFSFFVGQRFKTQDDARKAMEKWLRDLTHGKIPSGFKGS